jgi:tetratricopeptide (TPR) repeat protein
LVGRTILDRHARYYLSLLGQRRVDLQGSRQQEAAADIAMNMANIRAAWHHAAGRADAPALAQALDTLALFYYMRSWFAEGEAAFGRAAEVLADKQHEQPAKSIYARLLAQQGWFCFLLGRQQEGRELLQRGVTILRTWSDQEGEATQYLAYAVDFLAVVTYSLGDYQEADRLVKEGLALSQTGDDAYGMAIANNILSQLSYRQGRYEQARSYSKDSLVQNRQTGNHWSMGFSLTNLGRAAYAAGDFREAEKRFREALAIRQSLGDQRGQALCLMYLGDTALAEGDSSAAGQAYHESLAIFQEIGNGEGMAAAWTRLGHLARQAGENQKAAGNYHTALRLAQEAQAPPRQLDALMGQALLMAGDDPGQAVKFARLVAGHPAANQESRLAATGLLAELAAVAPPFSAEEAQSVLGQVIVEMEKVRNP